MHQAGLYRARRHVQSDGGLRHAQSLQVEKRYRRALFTRQCLHRLFHARAIAIIMPVFSADLARLSVYCASQPPV